MPDGALSFGKQQILELLTEVASELGPGKQCVIVVAGGAAMALHDLRQATRDVDVLDQVDAELARAVEAVAVRHSLSPRWLNASASPRRPQTLVVEECPVALSVGRLEVREVPTDQLFVMKLSAARAIDIEDLRALWPVCGFCSVEQAVETFYQAYPLEERDPHLADFVRQVCGP